MLPSPEIGKTVIWPWGAILIEVVPSAIVIHRP